jgi:transposase
LVHSHSQQVNRVHKVLETANIKLTSVASDVLGVSGRAMLAALLAGVTDPETLAELARGRLRKKLPALREALQGQVEQTHRTLLRHQLDLIAYLEAEQQRIVADIEDQLRPYEHLVALLVQIPGIGRMTAATILAEIGTDMSRFPSARHLASGAGLAPGNKQSGGKRQRARTTKGNPYLRAVLAESVWVISHTKDNYLSAQFHRLVRRIGEKRAVVAVSHSLLVIIYHLVHANQDYHDLGPHHFDTLDTTRQRDWAVRRLQALGYEVSLEQRKEENP